MTKYILALSLMVFTFFGCGNESNVEEANQSQEQEQGQEQQEMQGQLQEQMQQAPVDVDVNDEELQLFVDVSMQAQQVQAEAQQEMMGIVEEEGIDVETFNEIAQALQMGESPEDIDVDSDVMDNFDRASESIDEIGSQMEGKLSSAIEAEGMEMDRFQELNMAIQQDQELQQRAQQLMQEQMPQAPAQGQPAQQPEGQ